MSVERIREAILKEARAEAARIEAEARARHNERIEAAKRSLEQEFQQRFESGRQRAERETERELARRRSEHSMDLLARRNAILDRLFQDAGRCLAEAPDEQYRTVVQAWMKEVPAGVAGEVLCNERDAARLRPLIDDLNAARDPDAKLRLVPGDRPHRGGVIFRTEKFEIDLSLDARLGRLREDLAPEVARMLFGLHAEAKTDEQSDVSKAQ